MNNNNVKLLIMFVVIIGVFYLYTLLAPKGAVIEEPVDTTAVAEEAVIEQAPPPTETLKDNLEPDVLESADETVIDFSTAFHTGSIALNSGSINKLVLNKFKSYRDTVLDLIPENSSIMKMQLVSGSGSIDLSKVNFTVEYAGNINPVMGTDSLVLTAVVDTFTVRRTYVFSERSYTILHKVQSNVRADYINYTFDNGIQLTESNEKDDLGYSAVSAFSNSTLIKNKQKQLKDTLAMSGDYEWMGIQTKYFFAGIIGEGSGFTAFLTEDSRPAAVFSVKDSVFELYAGPLDYQILKSYQNGLDRMMDFGWSVIQPISRFLLQIFIFLRSFIPNYGLVIIVFSIIIFVAFYPLTFKSFASMRKMQALQPELNELKKKYSKDPQRLNAETMNLYKKYGVNPFSSCLPMFIQMPVIFAIYPILKTTIELRDAPFIFWITDLSAKDPYFILPILMGATMFLSQKATMTDNSQKMLMYTMPIMMTVFFINFPAGLALYWLMYNILQFAQQLIIKRLTGKGATDAAK